MNGLPSWIKDKNPMPFSLKLPAEVMKIDIIGERFGGMAYSIINQ